MFRIQDKDNILHKLIAWVSTSTEKLTDFNPGSAIRTLLEAVSYQLEEFYYDLEQAVAFAIKNAGFHAFGFKRSAAKKAMGKVTIVYRDPLVENKIITKGTELNTGRTRLRKTFYRTTEDVVVEAGSMSATLKVECTEVGSVGNAMAGEICKLSVGDPNVDYISNLEDIVNGEDVESEIHREVRFREYVNTLQRGTAEAVAYGIKQVPGVHGVWVDDSFIGFVHVYVHDINGNLSSELKQKVLEAVNDYRAGGIEVEVKAAIKKVVNLDLKVHYRDGIFGEHYNKPVEDLIRDYINNMKVSDDLNISTLVTVINDTYRDVIAFIEVKNKDDIITSKSELLRAGEIKVNREG